VSNLGSKLPEDTVLSYNAEKRMENVFHGT
jgi:hypothetical protein